MLEKQKVRSTKSSNIVSEMGVFMMDSSALKNNEQIDTVNDCGGGGGGVVVGDIERGHGLLSRTISFPQQHQQQHQHNQMQHEFNNVTQVVTKIIENLGNMTLHRKLERTQSEPLPQQANTSRYKTELCRPFEEAGECKYAEKCQFAHGYHELRNLQRHPKYKTEYCRTFHSVGFCPYGPRCHFVHNQDEARAMQQMQNAKLQNHSNNNSSGSCSSSSSSSNSNSSNNSSNSSNSNSPKHVSNSSSMGGHQLMNHSLPLSPPLSMSTGSDRESPTGSLSISPTNSMTNFPFGDQVSPSNSIFQTSFSFVNTTPPDSPNAPISPVNTPPPNLVIGGGIQGNSAMLGLNNHTMFITTPIINNGSQLCAVGGGGIGAERALRKTCSSPVNIVVQSNANNNNITANNSVASSGGMETDARLPVFNRFSSSDEFFPSNVAT